MIYFDDKVKEEFPNIPFDEIDIEMHDLIYVLNKIGLKTQYCCQGHGRRTPYVIFDESVTDKQILTFIKDVDNPHISRELNKWMRDLGREIMNQFEPERKDTILINWTWHFAYCNFDDEKQANQKILTVVNHISEVYGLIGKTI